MNTLHRSWFLLFVIICTAFILRVYKVSTIPPSLSWDEVSIGYNAYSILKTGADEHGKFFPLDTFVSYGDYKPPLPIYLTVPFVALFGLGELAVRLPAVLAGTVTVLITYFLVIELFSHNSSHYPTSHLALLTSFLLAISPWHIQLSRAGFEATIALLFVVLGVYMILKARDTKKLLYVCWLPFVASIYTFNSARYFSPLFALVLLRFCWTDFRLYRRGITIGIIIGIIALLPILPHLLSKEARQRFVEVNIFNDSAVIERANDRITVDHNAWWANIIHNRRVGFARSYVIHFFDNLESRFLFVRGDGNPKFSLQDVGQLYLIEAPLLVLGIFLLFRANARIAWLLVAWIVTAIIPAATARETPHALRIENSLPVWQMFIGYAILSVIHWANLGVSKRFFSRIIYRIVLFIIAVGYLGNVSYFTHNYFNHYSKEYAGEWQYGYKEAIDYMKTIKNNYDQVMFTEHLGRAYMYVLFYQQYDPDKFRQTVSSSFDWAGFYNVAGFDTYQFYRRGYGGLRPKTLYVTHPNELSSKARLLTTIRQPNGDPVFTIFDY